MSVAIKPLEDRILVQPLDAEQTTASGLVIPDTAKEKPQRARSSRLVLVVSMTRARSASRWTSAWAMLSCTRSTEALRSSSTVRTT